MTRRTADKEAILQVIPEDCELSHHIIRLVSATLTIPSAPNICDELGAAAERHVAASSSHYFLCYKVCNTGRTSKL